MTQHEKEKIIPPYSTDNPDVRRALQELTHQISEKVKEVVASGEKLPEEPKESPTDRTNQ